MADDDNAAKKNKGKAIITEQNSDSGDDSSLKLSTSSDDDIQSKDGGGGLLDSISELEKSLPIKRGLSSHFDGKSRSFGSLVDLSIESVQELEKKEHVLNKKRKLIIANEEYGKKEPVEETDDGSSKVEIRGPIDSNQNEDDKEKDDNTKNDEDEDKSKS